MKNLVLFLLLTATITVSGQDYDSLKRAILLIQADQNIIKSNLFKAHKQHGTGTLFLAGGVFASVFGAWQYSRQTEVRDLDFNNRNTYLMIVGMGMITAGAVLHIDSHKWIGRAGKRHRR